MTYMIFKNGSYIIAEKILSGSLTWTIKFDDIIEKSENIEKYAIRKNDKAYTFSTTSLDSIRGIAKKNTYHHMIHVLFSNGFPKWG